MSTSALALRGETTVATESAAVMARHGKSFAIASLLLPQDRRQDAAALYAWCRRADDAVDETQDLDAREALERVERELHEVYGGAPQTDPILAAFQRAVTRHAIPIAYPLELLSGMRMDVLGTTYTTLDDLLLYCHRAAGTVGLMMAHVLGVDDERALANAAHLGIGMQLTNICRDVGEDWERGRLYLPRAWLEEASASTDYGPRDPTTRRAFAEVTLRLLDEADRWYASGDRGLSALSFRAALSIRAARIIYSRIGARVRAHRADPLAPRAFVSRARKLALLAVGVVRTLFDLPRRSLHPHRARPITRVFWFPDDILDR